MVPGESTNQIQLIEVNLDKQERYAVNLPFTIDCLDIQQKLLDPNGSIETFNTLDWRTRIEIDDPKFGKTVADVSLNNPYSYRGYRFFQAQTVPVGNARIINLQLTPQEGGQPIALDVKRNGEAKLKDGTVVAYEGFMPDFTFNERGEPDTRTADYNNPVAVLQVTPPSGEKERVFAFAANVSDDIPVGAPKLGYKWRLQSYEKSPLAHVLSIKYDPFNAAFIAWYIGGFGLIFALIFVFFISHRRVWAMIEEEGSKGTFDVTLGGDTNRNHFAFEDKFGKIAARLSGGGKKKDSGNPA
jgi:cytochrome c biogenesis protein